MSRRSEIFAVTASVALLVLALVGGTYAKAVPKVASAPSVQASDAWARFNPVAGRPSSAYVTITTPATTPARAGDVLVKASTPFAKRAELHGHSMDGGIMRMPKVDSIPLAAGGRLSLAPGGFHIMLFEPTSVPKLGSSVPLTLTFKSGATLTVPMVIQALSAMGPKGGKPMMQMNDHVGHDMKTTNN